MGRLYTQVFFVSVYELRTWHRTQVSAVENSWGLCSDVFMHLHGSLMALLSPFTLCLFTLHLYQFISLVSGANKLISSLEKSAIVCLKFKSSDMNVYHAEMGF